MSAVVRLVDHPGSAARRRRESPDGHSPDRLLEALAQRIASQVPPGELPSALEGVVLLRLGELQADEAGEIVLRTGGSEHSVLLVTTEAVVETGRAVPHITAGGENVSGCRYVRFAGGVMLYYPPDLRLEIVHTTTDDV